VPGKGDVLARQSEPTAPQEEKLVEIRGLRFARGSRLIFDGVDLDIRRGSVTAIMGPSGTGKTTLLKLIGGQLRPLSGTIRVDGEEVHRLSRGRLYELRKRMGMLFQSGALLTDLDLFENVAFPLREHTDLPEAMIRDLVLMKLQAVGLRGARRLMPAELSGGMAKRVAFARALSMDPDIVFFDEPTTGLDPIMSDVINRLIVRLHRDFDSTIVTITHDMKSAMMISDTITMLARARIHRQMPAKALESDQDPVVRQFVDGRAEGPINVSARGKDMDKAEQI